MQGRGDLRGVTCKKPQINPPLGHIHNFSTFLIFDQIKNIVRLRNFIFQTGNVGQFVNKRDVIVTFGATFLRLGSWSVVANLSAKISIAALCHWKTSGKETFIYLFIYLFSPLIFTIVNVKRRLVITGGLIRLGLMSLNS